MQKKFEDVGVRVVYFPYTKGTSSTILNATLRKLREG
jgi:glycerol-3-phosphate cytidylyltransferase